MIEAAQAKESGDKNKNGSCCCPDDVMRSIQESLKAGKSPFALCKEMQEKMQGKDC
jgi:hypothetical protein